ncbi:RNA-binding protein [Roseateles aquatilis]|uniref:RNA-binding protein n=1 Tax=Roseateles aquatilis TaxID=431061 RepID=A0A246JHI0_9BURK|nr:YhbY family RNA-binding protein [Roseateles aquatilis]OWQ91973.1 RNA-binding protein [Roseateles aquatilis]
MPAIQLTPAQRKEKRADAHHLDPVVMIGADGLTAAVTKEVDSALNAHGLIKVRVMSDDRKGREDILVQLSDQLDAAPIQHIGKLLVLWRPMPEKEKAVKEESRSAAPKMVKIVKFSKSGNNRPQIKKVTVLGNQRVTQGGEVKRAKKPRQTSVKKSGAN